MKGGPVSPMFFHGVSGGNHKRNESGRDLGRGKTNDTAQRIPAGEIQARPTIKNERGLKNER